MNLFRAIATVGGYTLASRIAGFVRDILIAAIVGASMVGDAFFVAFKIPNLSRRLFGEGAFAAGFVPIFSSTLERDGPEAARAFAEDALAILAVTLGVMLALFELAMPWLMLGLAPGFAADPAKFDLAVALTRITFPYLLLVSLVSLYAGVLNCLGRFAVAAATPILLNLCLIGALLGLRDALPTPGHALAWGVAAAGVAQLVWIVLATARAGVRLRLHRPRFTPKVRDLLRRMMPATVGSGVAQINIAVDVILASLLPAGSVSYLFFADRLTQLPLGILGAATGTALLPLLSRSVGRGDGAGAQATFNRAAEVALLLALPSSVALVAVAQPIVHVLFERGAFDAAATAATAQAVWAYALGVPAYVLIKVLSPGFFANGDTKTPVLIGVAAMLANLVLNLLLMGPLLHAGLALATAIAAWANAALLYVFLRRRGFFVPDAALRRALPRVAIATAGLGAALWFATDRMSPWFAGSEPVRAAALTALVVGGIVLYAALAHVTGAATFGRILRLVGRRGH
ncbi:MAG: murein biosynthesis integral membrane protein MurJ [Proteobacteria bacterium]|nr:murein biosynthesis integral membrane protein MurJ [Pseudomonadota bacterium]